MRDMLIAKRFPISLTRLRQRHAMRESLDIALHATNATVHGYIAPNLPHSWRQICLEAKV
jgi:hypothetical protein